MPAAAIYLDHNATAPVKAAVIQRVADLMAEFGNPSSVHSVGRAARRRLEQAREAIASLAGASAEGVIFTASGTEANNLALTGFPGRRQLVSAIEHESVLRNAGEGERLPVGGDGLIDPAALEAALARDARPALVSVMLANNETGAIQPIAELAAIAHRHGALLHSDAVQAPGRIALDMTALGTDLMTLSAHKIGGPVGAACLLLRPGIAIAPQLLGGGQERGRRAGTENLPAIGGFALAAALAAEDLAGEAARIAALRDRLEELCLARRPEAVIFAKAAPRLPNTSCIALPGCKAETQVMALDLAGIAVSAGSACSAGKVGGSPVLAAMAAAPELAGSAIRVSLGPRSTAAEIERFAEVWTGLGTRRQVGVAA